MTDDAIRPADRIKLADDSIDLVSRGVDSRGRFGLAPEKAVSVAALTRGIAMSENAAEVLRKAISDPDWARAELQKLVDCVASDAAGRVREDQTSEAAILATLMAPGSQN